MASGVTLIIDTALKFTVTIIIFCSMLSLYMFVRKKERASSRFQFSGNADRSLSTKVAKRGMYFVGSFLISWILFFCLHDHLLHQRDGPFQVVCCTCDDVANPGILQRIGLFASKVLLKYISPNLDSSISYSFPVLVVSSCPRKINNHAKIKLPIRMLILP